MDIDPAEFGQDHPDDQDQSVLVFEAIAQVLLHSSPEAALEVRAREEAEMKAKRAGRKP